METKIKDLNENVSVTLTCTVELVKEVYQSDAGKKPCQAILVSDGTDVICLVLWDAPYFNKFKQGDRLSLHYCRYRTNPHDNSPEIITGYKGYIKII